MARRRKDVAPQAQPAALTGAPVAAAQRTAFAIHPSRAPRIAARVPSRPNPLKSGRRMTDMSEAELRAYALEVGVCGRDARELSPDALRRNCQLRLVEIIEELTS